MVHVCFICTSPLASSGQLVLAIDVIVKIKICLQLSPQIVYNCSPDFILFFLSLFAGKCLQRITRNCFQTVMITRSCLQTTTVKSLQKYHQELFPNCHQELLTKIFYRLYWKSVRRCCCCSLRLAATLAARHCSF